MPDLIPVTGCHSATSNHRPAKADEVRPDGGILTEGD